MDKHLQTGATGEELACRYLEKLGYTIHARNWRAGHLEIDIIAQWGDTLVIVEVKTRGAGSYYAAGESVTADKWALVARAADSYIRQYHLELSVRYDLIAVSHYPDGTCRIEHIPEAYYPNLRAHHPRRLKR